MNSALRIAFLVGWLALLPAAAQADIFMLVSRAPGDATAKGHERWIRVSSLDWRVTAVTSWTQGGGASVGKPNPDAIQFVLPTGPWSAHFMKMIASGKAEPSVVLDSISSDGRPLYRITLEGFFVTQYRLASLPATALPQDHLNGVFKIARIEYYSVGADGKVVATPVEWNVALGTVVPGL